MAAETTLELTEVGSEDRSRRNKRIIELEIQLEEAELEYANCELEADVDHSHRAQLDGTAPCRVCGQPGAEQWIAGHGTVHDKCAPNLERNHKPGLVRDRLDVSTTAVVGYVSLTLTVPLSLLVLWASVPLSISPESPQVFSLFAWTTYYIYAVVATFLGFQVFTLLVPMPSLAKQLGWSCILALLTPITCELFYRTGLRIMWILVPLALLPTAGAFLCVAWHYCVRSCADTSTSHLGNKQVFFALTLWVVVILLIYYFSQIFTEYFTKTKRANVQTILAASFPIFLTPLSTLLTGIAKYTDGKAHSLGIMAHRRSWPADRLGLEPVFSFRLEPLSFWCIQLFQQAFARNLFTSVRGIGVVLSVQGINLLTDCCFYALPMTEWFWHVVLWLLRLGRGKVMKEVLHDLESDFHTAIATKRERIAIIFYFVCMAQRISVASFGLTIVILRYNTNHEFYKF